MSAINPYVAEKIITDVEGTARVFRYDLNAQVLTTETATQHVKAAGTLSASRLALISIWAGFKRDADKRSEVDFTVERCGEVLAPYHVDELKRMIDLATRGPVEGEIRASGNGNQAAAAGAARRGNGRKR